MVFGVLEAVRCSRLLLTILAAKPFQPGVGHTWNSVRFLLTIGLSWRQRDSFSDRGAPDRKRAAWNVLGIVQLIQAQSMALCIVSNMVHMGWIGIFVIGDMDMGSALDARGDGGNILVALESKTGNVDVMLLHTLG